MRPRFRLLSVFVLGACVTPNPGQKTPLAGDHPTQTTPGPQRRTPPAKNRPTRPLGQWPRTIQNPRAKTGVQTPALGADTAPGTPAENPTPPGSDPTVSGVPGAEGAGELTATSDEERVQQAQDLLHQGQYLAAITLLKPVGPTSPVAGEAQRLRKQAANAGIHQLREKAMKAFQDARPLKNPQRRAELLRSARAYLVQALTDFPAGDRLAAVKRNLAHVEELLKNLP